MRSTFLATPTAGGRNHAARPRTHFLSLFCTDALFSTCSLRWRRSFPRSSRVVGFLSPSSCMAHVAQGTPSASRVQSGVWRRKLPAPAAPASCVLPLIFRTSLRVGRASKAALHVPDFCGGRSRTRLLKDEPTRHCPRASLSGIPAHDPQRPRGDSRTPICHRGKCMMALFLSHTRIMDDF